MSQDDTGEPVEGDSPVLEAPLVGEAVAQPSRTAWRQPGRIVSIGVVVALIVAAAVVIPMKLTSARTVSAAMGGVFSRPTVSIDLSASVPAISGDSVQLTLASRNGAAISKAPAYEMDLSVLRHSTVMADLRTTKDGVYLRIDLQAIESAVPQKAAKVAKLVSRVKRYARHHPAFAFVDKLVAGQWIGVRESALKQVTKEIEKSVGGELGFHKPSTTQVRTELSNIGSSIGKSWDEVASLHEVGSSNGSTEYSVNLPVRGFLVDAVKNLEGKSGGIPELSAILRSISQGVGHIPASLHLPIDLWISNGSLVKTAVKYHGTTVTAVIAHPAAPGTPASVTYVNIGPLVHRMLAPFRHWGGMIGASGSGIGFSSSPVSQGPSRKVGLAIGAVSLSYQGDHSFAALFRTTSQNSLSSIDQMMGAPGLVWEQNAPSRTPGEVSIHIGGGGTFAVVAIDAKSSGSCVGALYVPHGSSTPILGAKRKAGFPYMFRTHGSSCNAAAITSVPSNMSGWSGYAPLSSGMSGQG